MRRAYILVSPGLIADMCKPWEKKTISATSDIPEDALFISAEYLPDKQCFRVIFEHDSFDDIEECQPIPQKDGPKFTTYYDKKPEFWRTGVF